MSEEQPPRVPSGVGTDLVDVIDPSDPAAVREVFRARRRLTVSVMERPQEYRVSYSLGDIHRLTFLSHDERETVRDEWQAWHRKYMRLRGAAAVAWVAGAVAALACWLRADLIVGMVQTTAGVALPLPLIYGLAAVLSAGLLMTLPAFFAAAAAPALCESYLRGYADGMTRGVNRALRITPEVEQEMWDELAAAERSDAAWQASDPAPTPDRLPESTP